MRHILFAVAGCLFLSSAWAQAADPQTATAVINRCISIYHESGHPCACASDHAKNGSACGRRSAHDRPGGAEPVCEISEVTSELVKDYKTNEQSVLRERCHYHGR